MLILSRKPGEKIIITDPKNNNARIVIEVLDYSSALGVRLGFDGPQQYLINREEIDEDKRSKSCDL